MTKIGIDLGSRFVKVATEDNGVIKFDRYDTVDFYKRFIQRKNDKISIDTNALGFQPNVQITATGYGRNLLTFENATIISEIKAHFKGALKSTNLVDFILVDIGGQDSKVILSRDGYIEDFVMNDKCAASTGRFVENASIVLGLTLDELTKMKQNPAKLSNTCAVFCESELISLMAIGTPIEEIAAGINLSIAKRLLPLIKSFNSDNIFVAGGVAENSALIFFLSEQLGLDVKRVPNAQYNGAIGAIG